MRYLEFPLLKRFVEAYNSLDPPAVLLFGDSTVLRVADDDVCNESVEGLIRKGMGDAGLCSISGSAFHSQVFCLFCHCLCRLKNRPRLVVIPINLRSFSLAWDLHPDYQFLWETAVLDDFARCSDVVREPIPVTPVARAIFHAVPIQLPSGECRTISDFYDIINAGNDDLTDLQKRRRLEAIFSLHYQYRLYPRHRKLRYLGSAIKTLKREGISLFLYSTPINYQAGEKYVGKIFTEIVSENIRVIRDLAVGYGVSMGTWMQRGDLSVPCSLLMADLTFACDESEFFTPHNATEHLRYSGRKRVADEIVKHAERILCHE